MRLATSLATLLLLLLVLSLTLGGCSSFAATPVGPLAPPRPPPVQGPAGSVDAGARLWQDATIFDCERRLLALSERPGATLLVEMYEFDRADLSAALIAAHDRGADVRLIVDDTVAVSARTARRLAALGLAVRAYPVDDRRHQIDHVKLLLAGGEAVVGGMNWGRTSARNHDYALETRRPEVLARLRAIFEHDWALAGPSPGAAASVPQSHEDGASAPLLTAGETAPGQEIRGLLEDALGAAAHSIEAEVFVVTDPDIVLGLARARRRGVAIRVLLDRGQDVNRSAYALLRSAGVEVRWYPAPPGAKLHAKTGLFDGRRLLVGSANWSRSGLSVNHELDLWSGDRAAAAAYSARFEADWAASR